MTSSLTAQKKKKPLNTRSRAAETIRNPEADPYDVVVSVQAARDVVPHVGFAESQHAHLAQVQRFRAAPVHRPTFYDAAQA